MPATRSSSTRKPLVPAWRLLLALARRRMPVAKSSSTSKPLVPARRLLLALAKRRRQQRETALARQHHKDECFTRALQAEKQRMQVAAAQAKALADEA